MHHDLFDRFPLDGQLGSLHVIIIPESALVNLPAHASLCTCVSFPKAQMAGHGVARLQGHAHDTYQQTLSNCQLQRMHTLIVPQSVIVSRGCPIILFTLCYSDG